MTIQISTTRHEILSFTSIDNVEMERF